jgi:hypothetical protein
MRAIGNPTGRVGEMPHPRRFVIIGIEVMVLGAATLLGTVIAFGSPTSPYGPHSIAWWFVILGLALLLVGLEAVTIARQMTARSPGDGV